MPPVLSSPPQGEEEGHGLEFFTGNSKLENTVPKPQQLVIPFQILLKYLALQLWRHMNVALAIESLLTKCAKA